MLVSALLTFHYFCGLLAALIMVFPDDVVLLFGGGGLEIGFPTGVGPVGGLGRFKVGPILGDGIVDIPAGLGLDAAEIVFLALCAPDPGIDPDEGLGRFGVVVFGRFDVEVWGRLGKAVLEFGVESTFGLGFADAETTFLLL